MRRPVSRTAHEHGPRSATPRPRATRSRDRAIRTARRRLARTARRQYGSFTLTQAVAAGVSRFTVYRGVTLGVFERLGPGVFGIAGTPDSRERRWLAAQFALGGDAVLSHQTAAAAYGLEHGLRDDEIHLTVTVRNPGRRSGLVVHRTTTLAQDGVVTIGPLQVTSAARTLCDLAGIVDEERLRRLVATAVRRRLTTEGELRRTIARRKRFSGRAAIRRIVDELSPLEAATREEMESLFLRITTRAGIPPTHMNLRVNDVLGVTRYLDAAYLPAGIYVELDSLMHHGTLLDWHDDLRRENRLAIAGYSICVRFSYADLRDRPDEVIATLSRALDAATRART